MRTFPLISSTLLGLVLALGATACGDSAGDEMATTDETTDGPGDGDPSGDGDPETTGPVGCFEQPEICAQFVSCIGGLVPAQLELVESQYGPEGSCWCGATDDEAQACYETCIEEVDKAISGAGATVPQCHENWCTLDELDPDQPYGPVVGGACSPYKGPQGDDITQFPMMAPAGVMGNYCAPLCSGIANACPEHNQTSAQGTCYLNGPDGPLCASRCYVDPTIIGGTQCQCGAICRPQGNPDGEGNMRGLCTFD